MFDARELDLLVITTGGKFKVEESPYEKGLKIKECTYCRENVKCLVGLREDYIEKFGVEEVQAIS